jgi:ribosome-associated translation inhibitor RaiA
MEGHTELVPVGSTTVTPETLFFWHRGKQATIELTRLCDETYLFRASKSFRLLKQGEAGKENWDSKLGELNNYLKDKFASFQITVDYSNSVTPQATDLESQVKELHRQGQQLEQEQSQLQQEIDTLQRKVEHGINDFQDRHEQQLEQKRSELQHVNEQLDLLADEVVRVKQELDLWKQDGSMLAYLFTYTTDPELIHGTEFDSVLNSKLEDLSSWQTGKVKRKLKGPKFNLQIEPVEEPRVFHRTEHTQLLHPQQFSALIEEYPDLESELEELRTQMLVQYQSYANTDLVLDEAVVERGKATPARAVRSLLNDLDEAEQVFTGEIPDTGPYIGTVSGTRQVVQFDPADNDQHGMEHFYIVGGTGSGKTYLKRVLLENAASLDYNILSITPGDRDTQGVGLNIANPDHENGQALRADQYYPDHDDFQDVPAEDEPIEPLLTGVNAVTLDSLPDEEKQAFVDRVFQHLDGLGQLSTPLFVILEEAHNFSGGVAIDAIEKIVREGRKFGINLCLVTQKPTDFAYSESTIRQNLSHVFMGGRYTGYADDFLKRGSKKITDLDTGEALFFDWDYDEVVVDVRKPFTLTEIPADNQLEDVTAQFQAPSVELSAGQESIAGPQTSSTAQSGQSAVAADGTGQLQLTDDEQELLEHIKYYIAEEDQAPHQSACISSRHSHAPFGSSKTRRVLDQLLEKDVIRKDSTVRGNKETEVYCPKL